MRSTAAASLPCFSAISKQLSHRKSCQFSQVRAHGFRDEGRWSNIVDANMRILTKRIEEVRIKERLERCSRAEYGWNYAPSQYDYKVKKCEILKQCFDLVSLVGGTLGLTIFSGIICIYIVSLLVHLNQ